MLARIPHTTLPQYRPEIDGLRAVAVLSVLFFHLDLPYFSGGFVGVDLFFVISGFLITRRILTQCDAGTFSFSQFYWARAKRILPALLLTLFVCTAFVALLSRGPRVAEYVSSLLYSSLFLANWHFFSLADYFTNREYLQPLEHLWSIAVEEQFYLVWPVGIVLLSRLKNIHRFFFLLAVTIIGFGVSEWQVAANERAAFFLTHARIGEFALGGILALGMLRLQNGFLREISTLGGIAAVSYSVLSFQSTGGFPGTLSLIPCLGAFLLLLGGQTRCAQVLLCNRPLRWIGLMSYSLYLIHWPLIAFLTNRQLAPLDVSQKWGIGVASLVLAFLSFHLVEQPLRNLNVLHSRPVRVRLGAGLGVALALLLLGNGLIFANLNQFHYRSHEIQHLSASIQDLGRKPLGAPECRLFGTYNTRDQYLRGMKRCLRRSAEVVLVGDSYALNLYRGFILNNVSAIAFAGGRCRHRFPHGPASERCDVVFDEALAYIQENRATIRLIVYSIRGSRQFDPHALGDLHKELLQFHLPVLWVGGRARYNQNIEKIVHLSKDIDHFESLAQEHQRIQWSKNLEREMAALAKQNGLPFFSFLRSGACKEDGVCPILSETREAFVFDDGHWTDVGAQYFVAQLKNHLSGSFRLGRELSSRPSAIEP